MYKICLFVLCILLAGCRNAATTVDYSDFDEFRMEILEPQPDCPCTDCPLSVLIIRQAGGGYYATFEDSSRFLNSDEASQLTELFHSLEINNTFVQCLTGTPPIPKCRIEFTWLLPTDSNPLYASSFPCLLGADAVFSSHQTAKIMRFLDEIAAQ
jgi:hypothetical protein